LTGHIASSLINANSVNLDISGDKVLFDIEVLHHDGLETG
jgi:hypothetical protein